MTFPPTTSDLDATAATFRDALLRRDESALRRLMVAYQPVYTAIQREVAQLSTQIAAARAAGEPVRPAWLRRSERLAQLQRQVVQEWARFAEVAEQVISSTQRAAVAAAVREAATLTQAALRDSGLFVVGDVARLGTDALEALVGVMGDGSPLRTLLDALGRDAAQTVEAALLRAVATGRNPRQTARDIRTALGGNLNRALTIARTEHLRAYRSASLDTYRANADILRGWQWRASASRRTCPLCLAMDGREFALSQPFPAHPNCRCTMIPLIRNRPAPERVLGADWFAQQDEATQRTILGPGAFDLYRSGRITLNDLVEVRTDPRWGPTLYRRSIGDALAAAGQRGVASQSSDRGSPFAQQRSQRLAQLAALSDAELRAEIAAAQQTQWRQTRLVEHAKDHRLHFQRLLGAALTPSQLEELSRLVAQSWDRLFTEIDATGTISYLFLAQWKQSDATMVVAVSRDGKMRTCYPTKDIVEWLDRHPNIVEITNRVKP